MTGFTTNLSNLPPGTTDADIDRHFGERTHHPRCPQREGWRPDLDTLLDVAYELINTWDDTHEWTSANETRLASAITYLQATLEPECSCDNESLADVEEAAERRGDERREQRL